MVYDGPHPIVAPDVSGKELDPVLRAQALYGTRIWEAALGLASLIGFDETGREQFLDGLTAHVDTMRWEQRRDTAEILERFAGRLGRTAYGEAPASTAQETQRPEPKSPELDQNDSEPLNRQQQSWLQRFLDDDDVASIEALDQQQRINFGEQVGEAYEIIRAGKSRHHLQWPAIELAVAHMRGDPPVMVAQSQNTYPGNVRARLISIAHNLRDHLSYDEIAALIPEPATLTAERDRPADDIDI